MDNDTFDGAPNPLVTAAQNAIATKLGVPAEAVKIKVGSYLDANNQIFSNGSGVDEQTALHVSINLPGVMMDDPVNEPIKNGAKEKLKAWDALKKWEWDTRFEEATAVNADLAKATNGLDGFNTALLASPVLKTDPAKKAMVATTRDYALSDVRVGDYGVSFSLERPVEKDVDHKPELKKVAESIEDPARNSEIKEVLTARVLKNLEIKLKGEGKPQAEIDAGLAKAKADMAQIIIKANVDDRWENGVRITMRSPEQAKQAAGKQNPDYAQADNGIALRAENPLSLLDDKITDKNPHPALQKSLARALFYDKDKKIRPEMINFMGSMDMKAALAKEFFRLQQANPEKAEDFAKVLKSELFKIHDVDQKKPDAGAPGATIEVVAGKNDVVLVKLPLARKDLKATLEAMGGVQAAVAPAAVPAAPAAAPVSADEKVASDVIAAAAEEGKFAKNAPKGYTVPSSAGPKSLLDRAAEKTGASLAP